MPGIAACELLLPVKSRPLLSDAEQLLYGRLVRAMPGHIILAKVAMSQLLAVERAPTRRHSHYDANLLRQLVADFAVCKADFSVVAVVEVDRRVRQRETQRLRDRWKDELLRAARIKVIRVPGTDIPNEVALKALVDIDPPALTDLEALRRAS
jgi:hypothetical protein